MENHIKFLKGDQRKFLLGVQELSGLNVNSLAEIAGVTPRSYRDWKREKLCMTQSAAEKFCLKFEISLSEKMNNMQERWREFKREAGKNGGFAHLKKYGSPGTLEGRRKGGRKAIEIMREKGIIPPAKYYTLPKQDEEFAEYIGILLGDGGITNSQVTVSLNSVKDKEYSEFVVNLSEKLFKEKPRLFLPKNEKVIRIYYSSVNLVRLLVSQGLKIGNKVKQQVDVPDWIKSSPSLRLACLRGLMDTDGGVFIHKYKVKGKLYKYKKICFSNRSIPLLNFVKEVLEELEFTPKMIMKVENKKVWLYNSSEISRYLELVDSHNLRLLKFRDL